MASSEGWIMGPGTGRDGCETAADERARERAEAVEERMVVILQREEVVQYYCPECSGLMTSTGITYHLATCELLRARAEREIDNA